MKKDLHFGFSTLLSRHSLRSRTLHILCLSLALFATIGQAWALGEGDWFAFSNNPKIYFDNSKTQWSNVTMMLGRQWNYGSDGIGSYGQNMSAITNTQLYYLSSNNEAHMTTMAFFGVKDWGWEGSKVSDRKNYTSNKYTNSYNTGLNGGSHLYTPASGSADASLTKTDLSSYDNLNKTQTVKIYVKKAGSNSYSESASWLGTITANRYELTAASTASNTNGTISSGSPTFTGVITSTASVSVSNTTTGYTFKGWGTTASEPSTSSTSFEYTVSSTAIVYAFFDENTYTVTFANDGHGSTTPTGSQTVGQITGISIAATPNANYAFNTWTSSNGGSFQSAATTASNKFFPTANTTLTATFNSTATYSLTVLAGANISSVTGSTDPITLGSKYDITASPVTGYSFAGWTKSSGAGTATFDDASAASTKVLVSVGSVTVTASATENLSTVPVGVTSGQSSWGSLQFGSTTRAWGYNASVGVATTQAITAVPSAGYRFVTWALSGGAVLASGSLTDPTITICGNGNGIAGTATATFAEDLSTGFTIKGSFDSWTEHALQKKTGESTTSIGYYTYNLAAGQTYEFGVVRTSDSYFYKNGGTYTSANDGHWWTFPYEDNLNNCKLTTTVAGNYVFAVDYSEDGNTPKIKVSVAFPGLDSYDITYPASPSHYTLGDGNPTQGEELSSVTFAATADEFYYLTVTATDASDNAVSVTDNYDGTYTFTMPSSAVTINISAQVGKTIYLKKEGISSSWSGDVWVYFYKGDYWDSGNKGSGSKTTDGGNCISGPKKMTRLGYTDIFYYSYANDGYIAQMSHYVAFTDHEQSEYANFFECQAVYRGDFDERTPMFVVKNEYNNHNSCAYYNHGYWMTYNETTPGYTLRLYNQKNDEEPAQTITLTGNAGSTTFSGASATLSSAYTYYYELVRTDGAHFFGNNGTMTTANHEGWAFDEGGDISRCGLTTTAGGIYTFNLVCDNGRLMMSVDYPLAVGDLRVVHNNGTADKPSNYFKQTSETISDTVSFFIDAAHPGTLRIQTCTAVDPITWADASPAVSASLAGYETGVYIFSVEHSTSACSFTNISEKVLYTGNYYIRTDCASGGWKSYQAESNKMTYSEMLRANTTGYDYYFVRWVSNGTNVRYVVANDYSLSISDTLKSDVILGGSSEVLPSNANVRFMWNSNTNALERAYINGSTYASDRFLVMADASVEKIFDKDGNSLTGGYQVAGLNEHEVTFVDKNNWVYLVDIQANPTAIVNLTAKYNGADRTLLSNEEVLGGIYDADKKYTIRTIYNFKTNHLVTALLPNGNYSTAEAISADVMIIREGQEDASQITFSGEGKFTEVKTVFGTMTFNKWTLNNKSKEAGHAALSPALTTYARDLYWISFPFDVNLEEVFGFGEYGEHWIIEYYDGAGRAAEGFWADSDPNWKFVFNRRNYTLHANMGYVLALDLSQLGESSSVWNNNVEEISLYFPSAAPVTSITDELPTAVTLPAHTCTIERDHRYIWDSNWNLIGVPSYANIANALTDPDISEEKAILGAEADSLAFYYAWHPETNALKVDVASSSTFKAMYSYMVQYAGTINWQTTIISPAAAAPRRNMGDKPTRTLCLNLVEDGEEVDRTFIQTNDEYTNQFDINRDLAKADNADLSTIYTIMDEVNLAANCLPLSDEAIFIPVGVKANNDATFTFAMPEGTEGLNVSLYDTELETSADLSLENYSITLTKGTCNNRFFLRVGKHNAPTAIVPVASENGDNGNGAVKMIKDNLLFIYYNGVLYDARGMKVK